MIGPVDLHVHLFGASPGLGNRFAPGPVDRLVAPWMLRKYGRTPGPIGCDWVDRRLADQVCAKIEASTLAGVVLLAMDGPHDPDGRPLPAPLKVSNDFARWVAARDPVRLRFGASVHPYRPDALARLEALIDQGAALLKWLPSYQRIDLDDPRCHAVYELLRARRVPLLVHTGLEHTLRGGPQHLNHPRHLVAPLERKVTVIAAHCGLRLFLYEPCYGDAWAELARRYKRCYGDLSACWNPVRLWKLARWLEEPAIARKLVYGSDFPASPGWTWMSIKPGPVQSWRAALEPNPILRPLALARAAGVTESILVRGGQVLPPLPRGAR